MDMDRDEYQNLLIVLKLFQNRPNHLGKFLIDNKALSQDFLDKISDSARISDISLSGINNDHLHFNSILEMNQYYKSLVDDLENIRRKKSKEEVEEDINNKLRNAIESEDYEEASRIRDYMRLNNINKI